MSFNPYQQTPVTPALSSPIRKTNASERVKLPAILLMISGIVSLISCVACGGFTAVVYLGMQDAIMEEFENQPPDPDLTPEMMETTLDVVGWSGVATGVVGTVAGLVVIAGAISMFKMRGWSIALIASILSLIPCLQVCCFLSFPVGIFAIITLADSDVRAAFD